MGTINLILADPPPKTMGADQDEAYSYNIGHSLQLNLHVSPWERHGSGDQLAMYTGWRNGQITHTPVYDFIMSFMFV